MSYMIHLIHISTRASKLDLPPVKDCYASIGAPCFWPFRCSLQDLVNNKGALCILIVTFLDNYLHFASKTILKCH